MYITKHAIRRYTERCKASSDKKHIIEQLQQLSKVCDFEEQWNGNYIGHVGDLKLVADPLKESLLTVAMRSRTVLDPSPPVPPQKES